MNQPLSQKNVPLLMTLLFSLAQSAGAAVSPEMILAEREAEKGAPVCLSAGCFDLARPEELRNYLEALTAKNVSATEDKDYSDLSPKKRERVRSLEISLAKAALEPSGDLNPVAAVQALREIRRSIELREMDPYPAGVDLGFLGFNLLKDKMKSRYIRGKISASAAENLVSVREDRPIESLDLSVGGRPTFPAGTDMTKLVCTYDKKKDSHGTSAGFSVDCGSSKIKVKFFEQRTEPFATRIAWALGYHVDASDNAPLLQVAYEPKMFSEFGTHPGVEIQVKVLKVPVKKQTVRAPNQRLADHIAYAVLKDGKRIEAQELDTYRGNPELESMLAYVGLKNVQVQRDDDRILKVGPWSYNDFDHRDHSDIRGIVAMTVWLAFGDVRRDNNRLVIDSRDGSPQLKFTLSDLGGNLGSSKSRYTIFNKTENVEAFKQVIAKNGKLTQYQTQEKNQAFKSATRDDVAPVISRMLRISEKQLTDALTAAGIEENLVPGYVQELVRRRTELAEAFL